MMRLIDIFKIQQEKEEQFRKYCKTKEDLILSKDEIEQLKIDWKLNDTKDVIKRYKEEVIWEMKEDAKTLIMKINNQLEYNIEAVKDNSYFLR